MPNVLVIRLPVEDVDRRLLRQVLNKLRGEHELLLDAEEFDKIIADGREDDLKYLLDLNDSKLERYLNELHPPRDEDYEVPEIEKVQTDIKRGDIIQLGKHRLMCGDAENKEDLDKLCTSEIDMVYSDPPYGINLDTDWSGMTGINTKIVRNVNTFAKIQNDDKPFNPSTLLDYFAECPEIFIWGADYYAKDLPSGTWLVWDKRLTEELDRMYGSCFEVCWSKNHHKKELIRLTWAGFLGHEKATDGERKSHPTQKPVKLASTFIEKYLKDKQNVADLYAGSGSTLIACEQTNKTAFLMEIDPRYCQVSVDRWKRYTNKEVLNITSSCRNHLQQNEQTQNNIS